MGLLSKEEYVCARCGGTFEARLTDPDHPICPDCKSDLTYLQKEVQGYMDYASDIGQYHDLWEVDYIKADRDNILVECQSVEEGYAYLQAASEAYQRVSDRDIETVKSVVMCMKTSQNWGACYTIALTALAGYDNVFVKNSDVFAVGFTISSKIQIEGYDAVICACFTNDPYVPVFPIIFFTVKTKQGLKDIFTGADNSGLEAVAVILSLVYPNMTYGIQDLNSLKKEIRSSDQINGKIDKDLMLKQIDQAISEKGIFDAEELSDSLSEDTLATLNNYGYYSIPQLQAVMRYDRKTNKAFWSEYLNL